MTKVKSAKPKDEIELAKSIFDEIIEETESEDWQNKKPQKKSAATDKPLNQSKPKE